MKVRLLKSFAAPDGTTGQAGHVVDLPEDRARQLIDAGAAEEVVIDAAAPPVPGSLTQAGSFGGTAAPLGESGQTPGVAAPAPDPLLPAEAHADGLAVGAEGESAIPPTANAAAIEQAAEEDDTHDGDEAHDTPKAAAPRGRKKGKAKP